METGDEKAAEEAGAKRRRLRVLIVDDYPDLAESTAILLRLHNFEVDVALDGNAALRIARQHPPDAVLLDLAMPGMNGYQLARELRRMAGVPPLVIVITGHELESLSPRNRDRPFDREMVKPADPIEIVKALLALDKSHISRN